MDQEVRCRGCGKRVTDGHSCDGPFTMQYQQEYVSPCTKSGCKPGKWDVLDRERQARRCETCGRIVATASIPPVVEEVTCGVS
jgi:phage FluMu protein Com